VTINLMLRCAINIIEKEKHTKRDEQLVTKARRENGRMGRRVYPVTLEGWRVGRPKINGRRYQMDL